MAEIPKLPKAKYVKNGAYSSAYFTLGEKGNEPLLLCHGLAASGLQFVADAHFFASRGYYVIVPDLRGLGRSKTPDDRKESDFSFSFLASDLLAILDKEGIAQVNWVGNSLGGILALYIMGFSKERIKSLVTFGTAFSLDVPEVFIPILEFGSKNLGNKISAQLGARSTSSNKQAQDIIYEMLLEVDMFVVIAIAKYVRNYDLIKNALSFNRPILLIRGLSDVAINITLKPTINAMKHQPNFTLIDIKNAGHCANLDQPELVRQAILEFLDKSNAG